MYIRFLNCEHPATQPRCLKAHRHKCKHSHRIERMDRNHLQEFMFVLEPDFQHYLSILMREDTSFANLRKWWLGPRGTCTACLTSRTGRGTLGSHRVPDSWPTFSPPHTSLLISPAQRPHTYLGSKQVRWGEGTIPPQSTTLCDHA